ncbi:MAG: cytochrome c [Gammaproteobacteria bacterium]|nr:cytochrome c [Gammaproteobacteria bacterium]
MLSISALGGNLKHKSPLALLILVALASNIVLADIAPNRQAEIIHLLKHDCGSCHGMRLEGGLGPALVAKRFTKWDTDQLAFTILYGRPGTPMPPWRPFLTDNEAHWLATQLKEGIKP